MQNRIRRKVVIAFFMRVDDLLHKPLRLRGAPARSYSLFALMIGQPGHKFLGSNEALFTNQALLVLVRLITDGKR